MDLDRDSSGMTFLQYKLIYDHKRDCLKSLENIHRGDPYLFLKKMQLLRKYTKTPKLYNNIDKIFKEGTLGYFPKILKMAEKS